MNLLPLESFRKAIGWNPYHFYGLSNTKVPFTSSCNSLLSEYGWQDTMAIGRAEIREGLARAEDKIAEYLGYNVAPQYREDTVDWPRYHDNAIWRQIPQGGDGRRIAVKMPRGHIQNIGVETITSLGTASVTLSDVDGDGLYDTFTATLNVAVSDVSKVRVYFVAADRYDGSGLSDKWEIAPVTITAGVNSVSVRGPVWIAVKPLKYEGFYAGGIVLDPDTVTNFAEDIEFATKTVDTEGQTINDAQAVLLWETIPCQWWFCWNCVTGTYVPADSSRDPAAIGYANGRAGIRNAEIGTVVPDYAVKNATTGVWGSVSWQFYREPDRVKVRYVSGKALVNGQMDSVMQSAVWHLALAELSRPICACDVANREQYRWSFDLARAAGANDEQYQISPGDLDNPFGTRAGAVYAWRQVKRLALTPAIAV